MDNKKLLTEVSRWLRVGLLSASTLGPVLGTVLTRLREQQVLARGNTVAVTEPAQPVAVVAPEEDAAGKPSLSYSLALLGERAYNQELVRRAEELAEELRLRGGKLSQLLAERGSDLTHELGKRSSDFTHELGKRSNDFTHELGKQSEQVSKKLRKQTRKVSRNISEQDSAFWIVSGFSVGLIAASIVAFILLRNRRQLQQEQEEDEHILLSQNGHPATQNGVITSLVQKKSSLETSVPLTAVSTPSEKAATAVAEPGTNSGIAVPTDAVFLGVASTKQYYPVQTPLDQLKAKNDQPLDIIYFSSEEEAQAQGFTPAEK